MSDRQGLPLAISNPVAGNHNDLYNIEVQFEVVTGTLEQANIQVDGLFLNADAGFDSKEFRLCCEKKEINANVVSIKEMAIQIEMNILTNCFIMSDIKLREQMHGWTVLGRC